MVDLTRTDFGKSNEEKGYAKSVDRLLRFRDPLQFKLSRRRLFLACMQD